MVIFSNALSKSFAFSDAPTSRAVLTKRAWRSASVNFSRRSGGDFLGMPPACQNSQSRRFGLLLVRSRFIGEALALDSRESEVGAGHIVNAKLHAVAVAKVELGEIACRCCSPQCW